MASAFHLAALRPPRAYTPSPGSSHLLICIFWCTDFKRKQHPQNSYPTEHIVTNRACNKHKVWAGYSWEEPYTSPPPPPAGGAGLCDLPRPSLLSASFPATSENKKGHVFPSGTFMELRESALRGLTSLHSHEGLFQFILNCLHLTFSEYWFHFT